MFNRNTGIYVRRRDDDLLTVGTTLDFDPDDYRCINKDHEESEAEGFDE